VHASDGWIDMLAMFISKRWALCYWSTVFQRYHRRHRLPPVHRLPPGGDLRHEQCCDFSCDLLHRRRERCSSDHRQFLSEVRTQFSTIFFHTATLICLTIRVYSMTSLKSVSLKWWLYHQMFKLSYLPV